MTELWGIKGLQVADPRLSTHALSIPDVQSRSQVEALMKLSVEHLSPHRHRYLKLILGGKDPFKSGIARVDVGKTAA